MGRLDLYGRFFRPLLYRTILKVSEKSGEKCKQCKGKLVDTASYLYLIPVMFDQEHEESAAYYINHAVRIENEEQIPKICNNIKKAVQLGGFFRFNKSYLFFKIDLPA